MTTPASSRSSGSEPLHEPVLVGEVVTPGPLRLWIVSLATVSIATTLAALWIAAVPHDIYRLTEAVIRLLP